MILAGEHSVGASK